MGGEVVGMEKEERRWRWKGEKERRSRGERETGRKREGEQHQFGKLQGGRRGGGLLEKPVLMAAYLLERDGERWNEMEGMGWRERERRADADMER